MEEEQVIPFHAADGKSLAFERSKQRNGWWLAQQREREPPLPEIVQ
jgi:hypothetical protein